MTGIIVFVLKASIALSVFAIGLKATFSDAMFLFRRPPQLGRAVLSMSVLMPLFALVLVLLFDLHPAVEIALVAISVSPIPPMVGHLLGGPGPANRPTLAFASATRHPTVALGIAHANFPNQKLAAPAVVLYLLVSGVVSAVYLKWAKRYELVTPGG
jgi:bile acid:Na+ symporter, BASS family